MQAKYAVKVQAIRSQGRTDRFYVFIPLPLAAAIDLEAGEQESVAEILKRYQLPERMVHLVLVNGVYVAPGERPARHLSAGDQLAVWPPIAGG